MCRPHLDIPHNLHIPSVCHSALALERFFLGSVGHPQRSSAAGWNGSTVFTRKFRVSSMKINAFTSNVPKSAGPINGRVTCYSIKMFWINEFFFIEVKINVSDLICKSVIKSVFKKIN